MGRKKNKDTIEVVENLYIKHNGLSPNWHYYFVLGGFQYRNSTKTSTISKAKEIALNAYHYAINQKQLGKLSRKISFRRLAKKYIESLEGQKKQKFHKETIHRHFMEFFKHFNDITKIDNGTLNDYILYRKEKSDYKVKNQSINKENAPFNQMMQLAIDYGWLGNILRFKQLKETTNRRPSFTIDEYNTLINISEKRINEFSPSNLKGKNKGLGVIKYWNRSLLHEIIIIMANTGMRVDEIKTVRWKDIDWINRTIKLWGVGKVESTRLVIIGGVDGVNALKRIKQRRIKYIQNNNDGILDDTEFMQSLPNGVFQGCLKKGFRSLIKECNFSYSDDNNKHTLTSLRHTYATLRLTRNTGKRASMRALSKQMGTSQKMIEKHYGHDVVENYIDELRD